MKVQVVLSTMHGKDHEVLDGLNLQTPAIVVNQSDFFDYKNIKYKNNDVLFMTLPELGVGLSRNTALMRSTADIIIMADDDVQYVDGYADVVTRAFETHPDADMIVFNVPSKNPDRPSYKIRKFGRVRKYNCLRYGTYRMAFRLSKIKQNNIYFSLLFGGGAKYSSGEDSLFIYTVIKSGLKVFKSPEVIGSVEQKESTWFDGYTDKFFKDKGALFRAISAKFYYLLILNFAVRRRALFSADASLGHAIKEMVRGANGFSGER